jgi:hypothetical protein
MSKKKEEEKKVKKIFGAPVDPDADTAPKFVIDIISYLEENALQLEGIFRIPGDSEVMEKAKKIVEEGNFHFKFTTF